MNIAYVKVKREKTGPCNICLKTTSLSWDHVPPKGGTYFGTLNENTTVNIKPLFALLNSKLLSKIYEILFGGMHMGGGYLRYRTNFLNALPVNIELFHFNQFTVLVDFIICLKKSSIDLSFYQNLIDSMVYELYFPDVIQSADCEVLKHLTNLPEIKDDWRDDKKLEIIENVYKELSNPAHPVRIAMKKMREEVEEVRIIEELKYEKSNMSPPS